MIEYDPAKEAAAKTLKARLTKEGYKVVTSGWTHCVVLINGAALMVQPSQYDDFVKANPIAV